MQSMTAEFHGRDSQNSRTTAFILLRKQARKCAFRDYCTYTQKKRNLRKPNFLSTLTHATELGVNKIWGSLLPTEVNSLLHNACTCLFFLKRKGCSKNNLKFTQNENNRKDTNQWQWDSAQQFITGSPAYQQQKHLPEEAQQYAWEKLHISHAQKHTLLRWQN